MTALHLEEEPGCRERGRNGETVALLNQRMPNAHWKSDALWDGIFVRIYRHPSGYVADGSSSRPDWSRKQLNIMRLCSTYDEAKALLAEWYPKAVEHCANPITEENCPGPHTPGAMKWKRDNHCRECGWSEVRR